jgi:anthranilate/para-aminobenzoate synthase component I
VLISAWCSRSSDEFDFHSRPKLSPGFVKLHTKQFGTALNKSTMTSDEYKNAVLQAKEHILAGNIFQIVLSQRFERRTYATPFEVYRALRIVNPSPYMAYLQVCIYMVFWLSVFYLTSDYSKPLSTSSGLFAPLKYGLRTGLL